MQPQQNLNGSGVRDQSSTTVCAQCGTPMLKGMRFCRTCGNRLGEGLAEYTETVRFPNATATAQSRLTTPFTSGVQAPLAQQTPGGISCRRRLGFRGITWMWIALGIFFASGGAMTLLKRPHAWRPGIVAQDRPIFGVDGFKTTEGGVTFDDVEPPGSPADKAGLVGGDIITSFDGHVVVKEGELTDLLRQTPVGKAVEVIYLRDGQINKTQIATVSRQESNQLERAYGGRPGGKGMFGYDDDNVERVLVPSSRIFGVRLDSIEQNGPADLAGIKNGDIVIEFDKTPIRTTSELLSRVRRAVPYSTVTVVVIRDGQRIEIPVKMGKR